MPALGPRDVPLFSARKRCTPLAVVAALLALGCGVAAGRASAASTTAALPSSATAWSTHGVVKSFGPARAYVNIAHDKIPGYMEAMTMSFEPRAKDQLAELREGDRVAFTFTDAGDGRRLLDAIRKE